jgi:hypothetical protein
LVENVSEHDLKEKSVRGRERSEYDFEKSQFVGLEVFSRSGSYRGTS